MDKKGLLLLLLLMNIVSIAHAQSIFLDAEIIRNNLEKNAGDSTYTLKIDNKTTSILDEYSLKPDLLGGFMGHPFLSFIVSIDTVKVTKIDAPLEISTIPPSTLSGINVATYADALARFMVTRAKQELSIAFFNRLQKNLRDNIELRELFPQTHNLLQTIGDDIYQFNVYLTSLRDVFRMDLGSIYTNLPGLINHKDFNEYFKKNPELVAIFENSLIVINGLSNNHHPGKVFSELSIDWFAKKDPSNVKGTIQTIQFLSNSLRASGNDSTFWITRSDFEKDLLTVRIYLGLLYQKEKFADEDRQIFLDGQRFHALLESMARDEKELQNNLRKYSEFYNQFLDHASLIQEHLDEIKSIRVDQRTFQDHYRYFKTTINFFDYVNAFTEVHGFSIESDSGLKKFTHTLQGVNDLYLNIQANNYGPAIAHTISILDTLLGDQFDGKRQFFRYGTFMANVATATSSEEVQNIIEATALPAESYRTKRNSKFTVSVNSYLGANVLFTKPDRFNAGRAMDNHVGFYAPVGVEFSFGLMEKCGSISFLASVVDLGAITRFRLSESGERINSTISLGSIISPGFSLIYGAPKIPLSIGVSYSSQPSLQYDDNNGFIKIDREKNSFGFSAFVTVDIPLFNVYIRPE